MRQQSDLKSAAEPKARGRILDLFAHKPRERLTPAEILRRAGFARDELQLIVDALRGLCRDGQLVRLKKNHYALPDRQHLVKGRVHAHPDGYGFLIPEDRDMDDLYLNRREMRRVMHGDQVLVRGQKRLLGTYDELNGKGFLVPMDARIGAIPLKPGQVKPEKGKVVAA